MLILNRSNDFTLDRDISGSGKVIKENTNTVEYTGDGTYTGTTFVYDGIFSIGNGGTAGSLTGDINNKASVKFNHSDSLTYSGIISGIGTLAKDGSGALTMTADNTYTGATTINAGSVIVENDTPSTGSSSFGGSGSLVIQPSSASFTTPFVTSAAGFVFNSDLGGLTIGKAGNTANITVDSSTAISGPIALYGGNINLNNNLDTTNGGTVGDILLKASGDIIQAASTSVNTNGGDVTYWANSDGETVNGGSIYIQDGVTIDTRTASDRTANNGTADDTSGGAITLGGGTSTSTLASGTVVPTGYALNTSGTRTAGITLGTDTSSTRHNSSITFYSGEEILHYQDNILGLKLVKRSV